MRLPANSPVVALDIDGTLADYYGHFHWFAELYLQKSVPVHWHRQFRGEFSDALGLEKNLYRQIKLAYRQGGMKRSIKAFDGAGQAVRSLRKRGIAVWICTTRPWNRLDNIDPDTSFWIEHNLGRVDGVIYGEDKYLDLMDIVGKDRILGIIDDLPENVEKAEGLGLKWALAAGDHNDWWRESRPNLHPDMHNNLVLNPGYIGKIAGRWLKEHRKEEEAA